MAGLDRRIEVFAASGGFGFFPDTGICAQTPRSPIALLGDLCAHPRRGEPEAG